MKSDLGTLLKRVQTASVQVIEAVNKVLENPDHELDDKLIEKVLEAQNEWRRATDFYRMVKADKKELQANPTTTE
jgi:hypothetical protein